MFTGYLRDITDRRERERELRDSRARIVAAADEARRRIERDLHDGAQNRLLAVALDLKLLASALDRTDEAPAARRAFARSCGWPPTSCASSRAASTPRSSPSAASWPRCARSPAARRSPSASTYDSEARCPAPVEAAAYFLVAEAPDQRRPLRRGRRAPRSTSSRDENTLTVTIGDDGRGGADPRAGSGLRGLQDRLAALDGTLTIDSPPGAGTLVTGVIPCGS